jgi:putative ABC transport system substrate-binding protein
MRRREFITLLGGAAVAWPLAARAQQRERMRRIGALMGQAEDDPDRGVRVAAFAQGLQQLGWTIGSNVRIDYRWATSDVERSRYAAELVALKPDVLFATSGATVGALQQTTRTVPIVFVTVIDPVGGGWVASLAHPGGNATGFASHDFSLSGKWLELLKEIAPRVTRVAVIRDPSVPAGSGGFAAIQTVAPSLGNTGRCARRRRDRARHHGLRALPERRPHHGRAAVVGGASPRSHHSAGGPASAASGV